MCCSGQPKAIFNTKAWAWAPTVIWEMWIFLTGLQSGGRIPNRGFRKGPMLQFLLCSGPAIAIAVNANMALLWALA